ETLEGENLQCCEEMCSKYSMTGKDLALEWEAFSTNKQLGKIDVTSLKAFRSHLGSRANPRTVQKKPPQSKRANMIIAPKTTADPPMLNKDSANGLLSPSPGAGTGVGTKRAGPPTQSPHGSTLKVPRKDGFTMSPESAQSPPTTGGSYAARTNASQKVVGYDPNKLGLRG
ncbi:unnamed protein product, partial [Chrysoparadoxa australica]